MATAELGPNLGGEDVGLYATAYLDAARVLFTHADQGHGLVDLYFYPAAYNLRHGLELLAKQCADYGAYEMRDPTLLYQPGHSLEAAWAHGSRIPREIVYNDMLYGERAALLDAFKFLDVLVAQLHALDPDGTLFRYPEWIQRRNVGKVVVRGEKRQDQDVPFLRIDLTEWSSYCADAVNASQMLCGYLGERCDWLRHQRNEPPEKLADLVMAYVPPGPDVR